MCARARGHARASAAAGGRAELAVGDRVICTRNDRRLAVNNGSRGTVAEIDKKEHAAVVDLDDRGRVTLPARYLDAGNVSHAYALTGHKTQGLTVERAFVLADDQRALKEWGYVTLSRAREQTRLYTIGLEHSPPVCELAVLARKPAAIREEGRVGSRRRRVEGEYFGGGAGEGVGEPVDGVCGLDPARRRVRLEVVLASTSSGSSCRPVSDEAGNLLRPRRPGAPAGGADLRGRLAEQ